jgi:hypothetical protein
MVILDRLVSALVAISLAFLVWLYARSRDQEMLDNVAVPVRIALAPGQASQYDLEIVGPAQVQASFAGPPSRMRELRGQLQRGELHIDRTIVVPEDRQNESRYSDTVHIEVKDLPLPAGVTAILPEDRNRIPVTLHRIVERELPVQFEPCGDYRLVPNSVTPPRVLVRGPQEILERTRAIATLPYSLPSGLSSPSTEEVLAVGPVPLVRELEGRPISVLPASASARLTRQPSRRVYELTDVPVHFLCPANLMLRPQFIGDGRAGKINLRVEGPVQSEAPNVAAFIDLTRGKFQSGLNHETVRVQLPKDFQLDQAPPGAIGFELVPLDPTAKTPNSATMP